MGENAIKKYRKIVIVCGSVLIWLIVILAVYGSVQLLFRTDQADMIQKLEEKSKISEQEIMRC